MRFVFALLAMVSLLISPVTAAAAQAACSQAGPAAVAILDMPEMQGTEHAGVHMTAADPCCDHGAKHPMEHSKSCALACAGPCAAIAALPGPVFGSRLAFSAAPLIPARSAPAHPYEPSGLMRPPKSMA